MLVLRDIPKLPPGDLYRYEEDGFEFAEKKYADLLERVEEYRVSVRKPAHGVEESVLRWMQGKWPHLVKDNAQPPPVPDATGIRAVEYITGLKTAAIQFHDTPESKDRADGCRNCPFHIPISELFAEGSDGLRKQYEQMAIVKSRGKVRESDLGFCLHHFHDCRIAIHQQGASAKEGQPEGCWVR